MKENIWNSREFFKISNRYLTTNAGNLENITDAGTQRLSRYFDIYTYVYRIQTSENHRQRKSKKKDGREQNHFTWRGTGTRITGDFMSETMHTRREWSEILKASKEKKNRTNL